jgi:Tfp pilus assembly protein PilO
MTRNNKLVLGVILAAAVMAAYWMLILSPKRSEAADLESRVAEKQASVEQAEAMVAQYASQRDAYKTNYSTLVRLGKAVPGTDDTRSLMVQLADAAHRSGVDFRTIDVGGSTANQPSVGGSAGETVPPGAVPVGSGGFAAMPFKFTFTGRFGNLGAFFAKLDRLVTVKEDQVHVTGRLLRIESISLGPGDDGYPQIQAEIGASSYLAPAAKGVSGGTSTPAGGATTPASTGGDSTTSTTTATATGAIR